MNHEKGVRQLPSDHPTRWAEELACAERYNYSDDIDIFRGTGSRLPLAALTNSLTNKLKR
jgi:hypothetical protein